MLEVHEEVRRHISASNDSYKEHADKRRRFIQFEEGEMVMLHNCPERLPPGANRKPHPRNSGPSKILKKIGPNACVGFASRSWFECYVEDLTLYKVHDRYSPSEEREIQLPPSPALANKIVDVLD